MIKVFYSETECSEVWGGVSGFLHVNLELRLGCVFVPSYFNICMEWVLSKVIDQSHCGASVYEIEVTDLFLLLL